ncbi:MAG: hypothetical protein Kow0069_23620 [Promethearchaeota archaeon]
MFRVPSKDNQVLVRLDDKTCKFIDMVLRSGHYGSTRAEVVREIVHRFRENVMDEIARLIDKEMELESRLDRLEKNSDGDG